MFGPGCLQTISPDGGNPKSWEGLLSMPLNQIQDPGPRESTHLSFFPPPTLITAPYPPNLRNPEATQIKI